MQSSVRIEAHEEAAVLATPVLGVPGGLVVYATPDADESHARALAHRLGIALVEEEPPRCDDALFLRLDGAGLTLVGGGMELRGDFTRMLARLRPNNLYGEFLVKAAKVKGAEGPLRAVDATAGFGEDSLLLAAAGFNVTLFERNPVIAALLRDTLRRASLDARLAAVIARMELVEGNSVAGLRDLTFEPHVVLLDPMFPAREKSASVKKKAQLLQRLECPCDDEAALLQAALDAHPHKVLIKRPLKGPYLAGVKPAYELAGKAVRYDVLVPVR